MKNIALIGWNGKKNFGDTLMQELLREKLSLHGHVREYSDLSTTGLIKGDIDNSFLNNDILIFGGGNIISPDFWPFKSLNLIKDQKVYFVNVNVNIDGDNIELIKQLQKINTKWIVRDSKSKSMLSQHNIESKIIPDICLCNNYNNFNKVPKQALFFINQYYFGKLFENDIDNFSKCLYNVKIISKHIDWLNSFGWKIIFVPSQMSEYIDDRIPASFIHRMCKNYATNQWITKITANETVDLIKKSELVVSMRLHPALISISNHIPTIMMSFADKFDNIFADLNIENILINMKNLNNDDLVQLNQTADYMNYREKLDNYFTKYNLNYDDYFKGEFSI